MHNPLVLKEDNSALFQICRAVENRLCAIEYLSNITLPVHLLNDFDNLPESRLETFKKTGAAYRRSTKSIYVNKSVFCSFSSNIQQAVFAHEIGHAYADRYSQDPNVLKYTDDIGEEYLADRLACEWGFFEDLKEERVRSYGEHYVSYLAQWENENSYISSMRVWGIKRNAGLV